MAFKLFFFFDDFLKILTKQTMLILKSSDLRKYHSNDKGEIDLRKKTSKNDDW